MTKLAHLNLSFNSIGDQGVVALSKLSALTYLDLERTRIGNEGAQSLCKLTKLTHLNLTRTDVGNAGIRALLDTWLADGSQIRTVLLPGVESTLPPELLGLRDAQALLAAYANYRAAERAGKTQAIDEAKLLVLGNEAVGKTSLIRFLVDDTPATPMSKKRRASRRATRSRRARGRQGEPTARGSTSGTSAGRRSCMARTSSS